MNNLDELLTMNFTECRSRRNRRPLVAVDDRRGSITVLVCFLLVLFLATVAFSVDVAYLQLARAELRAATDAAARAGGEALSRLQDINLARQAAKDAALANLVAGKPLTLTDNDIVFGTTSGQATGGWAFTPNGSPTNSVRVFGRKTADSASGGVATFLGKLLGVEEFEPIQMATVVRMDRDIVLSMDRSGSMKVSLTSTSGSVSQSDPRYSSPPYFPDSRWAAAVSAVREFLTIMDQTPQSEHIALVSWASAGTWAGVTNTESEVNQPLTSNTALVNSAMDAISARAFNGSTNTSAGITRAVQVLSDPSTVRPFAYKTIIFLTDGQRTQGPHPLAAAQAAAAKGIVIHTITFGEVFDTSEVQQVSAVTGGKHWHAPNATALQAIFREIALTMPVVMTQ